ncbi:hypothetical protein E4U46_007461 [Claviceps purpurea]|nr:hypothetical protein E4U46_007461 [Claviceps purpurea]
MDESITANLRELVETEPPLPSPRTAGITHYQTAADSHLKAERDEAPVSKDLVANSVTESLVEPHQRNLGDAEGDAEEEDASVPLNSTTTRALRQLLQPDPVTSLSSVLTKPLTMELLLMKNNPPTAKTGSSLMPPAPKSLVTTMALANPSLEASATTSDWWKDWYQEENPYTRSIG